MTENSDLTNWILRFLDNIPAKPNQMTKLAVEHATGLLQNTSLKTQGIEKIVHHTKNVFVILRGLIEKTSLNCDEQTDTLSLMAFTYVFSILY